MHKLFKKRELLDSVKQLRDEITFIEDGLAHGIYQHATEMKRQFVRELRELLGARCQELTDLGYAVPA